jgi:hypothetical protein
MYLSGLAGANPGEVTDVRLGQKQTFAAQNGMSALPPIADIL